MNKRILEDACAQAWEDLQQTYLLLRGEEKRIVPSQEDRLPELLQQWYEVHSEPSRYEMLLDLLDGCAGQAFSQALLEVCDSRCRPLLEELGGSAGVTMALASMIERRCVFSPLEDYDGLRREYEQVRWLLHPSRGQEPFYLVRLTADERLLGWLLGNDMPDYRMKGVCVPHRVGTEPPKLFFGQEPLEELCCALSQEDSASLFIQIAGLKGSGRRATVKNAVHRLKKELLLLDYQQLLLAADSEQAEILWAVSREARLYQACICLYGIDEETDRRKLVGYLEYLREIGVPLVVCTPPEYALVSDLEYYVEIIKIPQPTRNERICLWEGYWKLLQMEESLDVITVATKFKLAPGEIRKVVQRLKQWKNAAKPIDNALIARTVYDIQPPTIGNQIKRVRMGYTLEDIKLHEEGKRMLRYVCDHVTWQHRVFDEWNMESRYPYGKGVVALFTGQSGTGKTMAANIISSELGIALYRVDLSQVIDKYIGETEKRLEEIFTAAEKSNVILFFDEADAVFGKRSDVKDAKDRYANTEVSYILQRIEDYEGIVILATNYRNNIDDAFMRRIRYVIDFPMPSPKVREQIWCGCFPAETPTQDIDYKYLAEQFEFTGGVIKNIVLAAVYYAAAENVPVGMLHILRSVRVEQVKKGKVLLKQDLGAYAYLFEQIV